MGGSSTVPKEPARGGSTLEDSRFEGATGLAGAGAGAGAEVGALVGDATVSGSSVVVVMGGVGQPEELRVQKGRLQTCQGRRSAPSQNGP